MFASIIERLTSLVSKYLVISCFVPVAIFSFLTAVILYPDLRWFREWAKPELFTEKLFDSGTVLVALAVAAYVIATIETFLREVLEGKHFIERLTLLTPLFEGRQQKKLAELEVEYASARQQNAAIGRQMLAWQRVLSEAAQEGMTKKQNVNNYNSSASQAAAKIAQLQQLRKEAKAIDFANINAAVIALSDQLRNNDETVVATDGTPRLYDLRVTMLILLDYAHDVWSELEMNAFNERVSRFGVSQVAPTAMGNVALSMQGYALVRYDLNLDKLWGKVQIVLQSNKDFYGQLQDAKAQLDFLVNCCWLSMLATVGCLPILLLRGHAASLFVAVALGGPASSMFFYFLGVKNYQGFAELVRSGLDMYRFQLLDALHLKRPRSVRDERALWGVLNRLSYFGVEAVELSYEQDRKV
jgi:hypothetical protein